MLRVFFTLPAFRPENFAAQRFRGLNDNLGLLSGLPSPPGFGLFRSRSRGRNRCGKKSAEKGEDRSQRCGPQRIVHKRMKEQ